MFFQAIVWKNIWWYRLDHMFPYSVQAFCFYHKDPVYCSPNSIQAPLFNSVDKISKFCYLLSYWILPRKMFFPQTNLYFSFLLPCRSVLSPSFSPAYIHWKKKPVYSEIIVIQSYLLTLCFWDIILCILFQFL